MNRLDRYLLSVDFWLLAAIVVLSPLFALCCVMGWGS